MSPSISTIARLVCAECGVSWNEMRSHRRDQASVLARHVAMFLAYEMTPASYPQLGMFFDRDHTSVLAAVRRVRRLMQTDPALAGRLNQLRRALSLPHAA